MSSDPITEPIAIVGLGCVLPDAHDVASFLDNLRAARYSITEVERERWDPEDYYSPEPREGKTYSKIGGWVRGFELDERRFRMLPATLQRMDLAQRWAIAVADQALQDAGCRAPGAGFDPESCAVVMGTSVAGEYRRRSDRRVDRGWIERVARECGLDAQQAAEIGSRLVADAVPITEDTMPGELPNIVAGRVAQALDLHGANYTTDAACASALAAVLDGCMLLQTRHADWVVAGGADRSMDPAAFAKFCAIGALSAVGSFPFDIRASGFVMAEGAGAVVLRRLADAEAAGQRVYAVIRGVAGASDGRGKGITAPNPRGQENALRRAYRMAGYGPETVDLIEAHGTSTPIGDATEVTVLAKLFADHGRPVALGSVKSMLGHLKAAAGIAGLLKAALALHHREILPSAGFETPNPRIAWSSTPFHVPTEVAPWPAVNGRPPRVALSAFGFGGTNFHLTLEAPQGFSHPVLIDPQTLGGERPSHAELRQLEGGVFCFAGADLAAVIEAARTAIAGWLARGPLFDDDPAGLRLSVAAHEQLARAGEGPVRLAVAATDWAQLRQRQAALGDLADPRKVDFLASQGIFVQIGEHAAARGKVAFLFPGQGSQYLGMLADLRRRYQAVDEIWAAADGATAAVFPMALSRIVAPQPPPASPEEQAAAEARLTATEYCQPAVVAADLALLALYAQHGIRPDMVAGHSLGEYAALVAAGAMSIADAERAVAARGAFMASLDNGDRGAMASLSAPEVEVQEILDACPGYVVVSNRNSPRMIVVSGETPAVEAVLAQARERGIRATRLPVSHAFHSQLVAAADEPLGRFLATVEFSPPLLPVSSNLDAGFYPAAPERAREEILARLCRQMSSPVEWTAQIRALHQAGARIWIECGPKRTLTTFNGEILSGECHLSVTSNHPKQGGMASWLAALGRLWVAGLPIELPALDSAAHTPLFRSQPAPAATVAAPPPPAERAPGPSAVLAAAAALSGYPARLLTPTLHMERDLGMGPAAVAALCRHLHIAPRADLLKLSDVAAAYVAAGEPPVSAQELAALSPLPPMPPTPPQRQDPKPPSPPAADGAGTLGVAAVEAQIVHMLSEKTGYPPDTLAVDLDLEGDLGIDTVKQAEVLGAVFERYGMRLPEGAVLAQLNTIEKLARAISGQLQTTGGPGMPAAAEPSSRPAAAPEASASAPVDAGFFRARPEPLADEPAPLTVAGGVVVLGVPGGDGGGLARAAAKRLRQRGFTPRIVAAGDPWPEETAVGLLDFSTGGPAELPHEPQAAHRHAGDVVGGIFRALKAVPPTLFAASVSRLDGAHGFLSADRNPIPLAAHGVLKSYAHERPELRVRCYDLDPALAPATAGRRLVDDLLDQGGPLEVGLGPGGRSRLVYAPAELTAGPELAPDDVFLVSGGAGGVTAACMVALARELGGGRFALLGRTRLVDGATELAALSAAELEQRKQELGRELARQGQRPTPVALDQAWQPFARSREVSRTLAALEAAGATALYVECDVTDLAALTQAVERCRRQLGAPTVVVHGAGVERSRQTAAKSEEELAAVLAVKVDGWWNLRAATGRDPVRLFVSFASVVGRFGNAGQADYAAANAVLAGCAQQAADGGGGRHLALAWTAWSEVGMATRGDTLERLTQAGVEPLRVEAGSRAFVQALASDARGELLVANGLGSLDRWDSFRTAEPAATVEHGEHGEPVDHGGNGHCGGPLLERLSEVVPGRRLRSPRRLDAARDVFLADHRIHGYPYLPGVLGLEGFAEAALCLHDGLACSGFEAVSFDLPLKLTGETLDTEVVAETEEEGEITRVRCRWESRTRPLRGAPAGRSRVHFQGTCLLQPRPAALEPGRPIVPGPLRLPAEEVYRRYFHGASFQVHGGAVRLAEDALEARINRRPKPLFNGRDGDFAVAPLVLEAAVQNAGLLAMIRHGVMALPTAIRRIRLAAPAPADALFTRARPVAAGGEDLVYDCEVLDSQGNRFAVLEGLQFKQVARLSHDLRLAL